MPDVDPESYTLEVEGVGCKNISLSLEDIKKLPQVKIVAAVQCGGNRRLEMKSRRTLKGSISCSDNEYSCRSLS